MINLFSVAGVILFACCIVLILFAWSARRSSIISTWILFNAGVALWGLAAFIIGSTSNVVISSIWWRIAHLGIIFIPVFLVHNIVLICDFKKREILLKLIYGQAIFFLFTLFTPFFLGPLKSFKGFFYLTPKILYFPFFFIWISLVAFSLVILFQKTQTSQGLKGNQVRYLFWALLLGFTGGITNFFPVFNINVYPFGNLFISLYCLTVTYAIFKYRLLDISLLITRTTIFFIVYAFVLGIPFFMAFGLRGKLVELFGYEWWLVPLATSTVLATTGPFIYVYFQNRAEDRLLQEQRRYQATLRQASAGMGKIKDLKRLVTLIVHIMTRTVRVEYSMVFLNDIHAKKFRLGAYRSRQVRMKFRSDIDHETALVRVLQETQSPIVYDEIKQRTQDFGDLKLARLEAELKAIDAALVIPSFIDEKLVAILVMGAKVSGKIYSSDDLSVFSILANQSALAIENAQFYDEMKSTHVQLLKAEKMATIGTLADGLSHQINNRLHAMGFIAGDALDTLKLGHNLPMSLEVKEMILDLEHALNRIESNVQQGGEIVQGLLKYTRKDDGSIQDVALDKLIEAALEMTQFKIKPGEMSINHEYPSDLPKIRGNFTQLQEVFFNLIDNAYDAMMQRKAELKEANYTPTIKIIASGSINGHLNVLVEDNGMGIQEQDKEKIFTPFFTTKLSSKKGTGLGLYVIQRLIEENHSGTVVYESKYQQGTKVHLTLPAA
ncbi:MAG: GAF domain-containing protein [Candidatus Omnitrophica bacterium]|nr:GAF domain-containing protein [Candidatus Omnitrophota bacterium]